MGRSLGLLALAVSLCVACSDGDTPGGDPGDIGAEVNLTDTGLVPGDAPDGVGPVDGEVDVPPKTPEPGEIGYPCDENTDCLSGFCVEGPEGDICTKICDEDCPEGYHCKAVQTATDVLVLCVPELDKLCTPCGQDLHCGGGACLTIDGALVCAPSCTSPEDCPTGYGCEDVSNPDTQGSFCLPITGSCVCGEETAGTLRSCFETNEVGMCQGLETCEVPAVSSPQTHEPVMGRQKLPWVSGFDTSSQP
jgi:hypothetical protein